MGYGMHGFGDQILVYGAGQACPTCPPYISDVEMEYVPKDEKYNEFNGRLMAYPNRVINASFSIFGNITLKKDGELIITATGRTTIGQHGTVTYYVHGTVLIDGQRLDKKRIFFDKREPSFFPTKTIREEDFIGSALFNLPKPKAGKRYELLLEAFYNFHVPLDGNKIIRPMKHIFPLNTRAVQK